MSDRWQFAAPNATEQSAVRGYAELRKMVPKQRPDSTTSAAIVTSPPRSTGLSDLP